MAFVTGCLCQSSLEECGVFQGMVCTYRQGVCIRLEAASYFVDVTLKHNFRMVDQCNVVTDFFHGSHVVGREDDGVSLIFQFQDFPFQQFSIDRIESGERFVEDQQLGVCGAR